MLGFKFRIIILFFRTDQSLIHTSEATDEVIFAVWDRMNTDSVERNSLAEGYPVPDGKTDP